MWYILPFVCSLLLQGLLCRRGLVKGANRHTQRTSSQLFGRCHFMTFLAYLYVCCTFLFRRVFCKKWWSHTSFDTSKWNFGNHLNVTQVEKVPTIIQKPITVVWCRPLTFQLWLTCAFSHVVLRRSLFDVGLLTANSSVPTCVDNTDSSADSMTTKMKIRWGFL